jgi:hypothetical protein
MKEREKRSMKEDDENEGDEEQDGDEQLKQHSQKLWTLEWNWERAGRQQNDKALKD